MLRNKITSIILVVLILLGVLPTQSFASGNTSVELKKKIESDYGFIIEVPKAEFDEASEEDRIFFYKSLDTALSGLNKGFVKEVTDYYKSRGIKSKIGLSIVSWGFMVPSTFGVSNNTAKITLDFMHPSNRDYVNKYILAHEFGHMVNVALDYKEGSTKIQNNWLEIDKKESDKDKACITYYAQNSYREDFAEMFAHMSARGMQDELFSIMIENPQSVIIEKMNYLDSLLKKHFKSYKGIGTFSLFTPQKPSSWSKPIVDNMIVEGKLAGTFTSKYQANITRAEFCELLITTILDKDSNYENSQEYLDMKFASNYFKDISPYNNDLRGIECFAINKAHSLGLVNGKSGGYFEPLDLITRQEVAMILKNAIELVSSKSYTPLELPFKDKEKIASWAISSVEYIYSNNIMRGTPEGNFEPLGLFTYEQAYSTLNSISELLK